MEGGWLGGQGTGLLPTAGGWSVVGPAWEKQIVTNSLFAGPQKEQVFDFCLGLTFYFCAKAGERLCLL